MKKRYYFLLLSCVVLLACALRECTHTNEGLTKITGTVGGGSMENAYLLPYSGPNYRYFSPLSYYILDRGYTHHQVYQTLLDAYGTCETTCPNTQFRIMEASRKGGGRMLPHRTHQNGFSIDFMTPLHNVEEGEDAGAIKSGDGRSDQHRWLDRTGVWHYLLDFDEHGNWSDGIKIDFPVMGRHLLALDDAARQNGLRIKKVILKINLKDELFATPEGQALKKRGVYFARKLHPVVDDLHDDHYHVDFQPL